MLSTVYSIPLNEHKEENVERGTAYFPCSAYTGEVHQFITRSLPPHWHREMEMFVLDEGMVRITTVNGDFELHPGDGYFVNSNILHGIYALTEMPCRFHSIVFDPAIIAGAPGSAFDLLYIRPFIEHASPIWSLSQDNSDSSPDIFLSFENAYQACAMEQEDYEFIVREALSRIILKLKNKQNHLQTPQTSQQELRIKDMLTWIDAHYADSVTVTQLADSAGISVRECQRSFSATLHTSPMNYLMNYRIAAATELLRTTNLPITEIALRCGFESPSYFTKQFKSLIGKSPRQYRFK
jgi:AraC family transcriptional regulator, melibiose operon regulatory protein